LKLAAHESDREQRDRQGEEEVNRRRGDLKGHHCDEPHTQRQERREEQCKHAWKLEIARVSRNLARRLADERDEADPALVRGADGPPARYEQCRGTGVLVRGRVLPAKDGIMWNPASPTRSALALSMAAAVAFLGSAMMLKAGATFPQLAGGRTASDQPGVLVLSIVIVLAATGVLLAVMAGRELLSLRRGPHPR
jgi:hypothetical protein